MADDYQVLEELGSKSTRLRRQRRNSMLNE